jgi:N-formylglutamate deformylase
MRGLDCLLLHIPHASKTIPKDIRHQFVVDDAELSSEINLMTDHFTDWLMEPLNLPPAQKAIASISRLVVDMERFSDDNQESMSAVGMGVIYNKGSQRQDIRSAINEQQRTDLLSNYYVPHHNELNDKTQALLKKYGKVLVLDIHSYPRRALPYEVNRCLIRPEICLGTDTYHTPISLAALAENTFKAMGFTTAFNSPFAGTLIPSPFWQHNKNVMGMMIEIRRDLYMDESTFKLRDNSLEVRYLICDAIIKVIHSLNNTKEQQNHD